MRPRTPPPPTRPATGVRLAHTEMCTHDVTYKLLPLPHRRSCILLPLPPLLLPTTRSCAQLQALQLHFAAVNRAPPSITGNTDALAVWMQGLACRAYGLRIMAGSIKRWRVLGPHDSLQHIELAEPGEAVRLMCECLVAGRRSRRGSSSSNDDVRSSSGASAGGKLKRKRKGGAQASAAARMPASTPDPPLTPTLQRGTDESRRIAVAAAAAADERDGSLTAGGSAACKRAAGLRRPRLQVGDGAPQAMSAGGTSKDAGRCKSSMHASTGVEARKRRNRSC